MSLTEPSSYRESVVAPAVEAPLAKAAAPSAGVPLQSHALLSNGVYQVQISAEGHGRSQWNGIDITRWRPDNHAPQGFALFLQDMESGSQTPIPAVGGVVSLRSDVTTFQTAHDGISAALRVFVHPVLPAEIRFVELTNDSGRDRVLAVTSYIELALAPHDLDRSHPAFSKLFVQTALPAPHLVTARRRPRAAGEDAIFAGHRLLPLDGGRLIRTEFETSRLEFIGRNRSIARAAAFDKPLSCSLGSVLDPVLSHRAVLGLAAGETATIGFAVVAGLTEDEILASSRAIAEESSLSDLVSHAAGARDRILGDLGISGADEAAFQELAVRLVNGGAFAAPGGLGRYREDRRVVKVNVTDLNDAPLIAQLANAGAYLSRMGVIGCSLFAYLDMDAGAADRVRAGLDGKSHPWLTTVSRAEAALNGNLALGSDAAIVIDAFRGDLGSQLLNRYPSANPRPLTSARLAGKVPSSEIDAALSAIEVVAQNGFGGFTPDGREYVIDLEPGVSTPAPWINAISNPAFGLLISETGAGYTWSGNSQRNRLTPWSNDQTCDSSIEALYIRDEETGSVWCPSAAPIRDGRPYRARHGQGYSVFEHNTEGIEHELTVFVPVGEDIADKVRVQHLRIRNNSARPRRLSVTSYVEWVLGTDREGSQAFVRTSLDAESKALFAVNRERGLYGSDIAFQATSGVVQSFTGDRSEFLGGGALALPDGMAQSSLLGRTGANLDPCGAVRTMVSLQAGEEREIVFLLGEGASEDEARDLIAHYTDLKAVAGALDQTKAWWDNCLGAVTVETPDRGTNWLLNRWLLYQDISCRFWGRTAFYQSGGAFGFRDQLQDTMALVYARPDMIRGQILRAAARQFVEGDVQHWWFPDSGFGVRTRMSDDLIWLPFVTAHYVRVTGDRAILREQLSFVRSAPLEPGVHDRTEIPEIVPETRSLLDHCRMALSHGATSGEHGLPLIGTGDWNDGFNMVGAQGRGESVWLAWFLIHALNDFAYLLDLEGECTEAAGHRATADRYARAVEEHCWDGDWYVRAYFDSGDPLGSACSDEAKIDSIAQSWAVISGAGDSVRSRVAIESAKSLLISEKARALLLFTPPFDKTPNNPGYIKGYVPGVRENGGQYTHGSLWLPLAFARIGDGDTAVDLLKLMSPVDHSSTHEDAMRYAVEPYVVAADVYSESTLAGHGGWTWYTGSAGWMYRVWLEEVLGFHKRGETLEIKPVLPGDWPGYSITYRYGDASYVISVDNRPEAKASATSFELDGELLKDGIIPLSRHPGGHTVKIVL